MERLTSKNEDGYFVKGLNGKSWSDNYGRIYGEHVDKLAEYENIMENQEKGCEYCNELNDACNNCVDFPCKIYTTCGRLTKRSLQEQIQGYYREKELKFCPMCGKKLI